MNPLLALSVAHMVLAAGLAFLPAHSIYRPIFVALVAGCCVTSFHSIDQHTWWGEELAEYVCGFAMYASYSLCLRKLVPSNTSSSLQKFKSQFGMLFSPRWGIPAKELPSFSAEDSELVPSRGAFLSSRLWTFAWTVGAFATLHHYPLDIWPDDFQPPKSQLLRRLPEVSAREWIILFYTCFGNWFMPFCLFTAAHSLASLIAVAFGDAPINWRPLFGDIREAYTVQGFFGVFWHKLMRNAFTGHASLLVNDVLGMPPRTPQSRAAIIFVSFLISGAMHSLVTPVPLMCAAPKTMLFYSAAGGAVVLENVVQTAFQRYSIYLNKTGLVGKQFNWHVLGYLWVISFHLWTTAKSTYPLATCDFGR